MKKLIEFNHITKSYGTGHEKRNVIDDVTNGIQEGEFVAIMGPSGSGKSTLLFAISGMDHIDSGTVLFEGENLSQQTEENLAKLRRTQMGFVFQQPTMLKNLNILDNIILPGVSGKMAAPLTFKWRNHKKNTAEMTKRAKILMDKTGISELCNRDITQVSGGQLQRAGICRALITNPTIIFGDEPTGALNSKSADEIMSILAEIHAEGTAVLLVTHDAKVAARSERVLFMCDGKIVNEMQLGKAKGEEMGMRIEKITAKMLEIGV